MICRLPVDLLPSGLWYSLVRRTEHHKTEGIYYEEESY